MILMNEWKEIKMQKDIGELLDAYGGFYDVCLTGATFQSGTIVIENLSTTFGNAEIFEAFHFCRRIASEKVKSLIVWSDVPFKPKRNSITTSRNLAIPTLSQTACNGELRNSF